MPAKDFRHGAGGTRKETAMRKTRNLIVGLLSAVIAVLYFALPASATTHAIRTQQVSIEDNNGTLTTNDVLFIGEVLTARGYVTGNYVVTGYSPKGTGFSVVLSPAPVVSSDEVLDFTAHL